MDNGERIALEMLNKLLDLAIGTFKTTGYLSVQGFNAIYQHSKENRLIAGENDIKKLRECGEQIGFTKINGDIDLKKFINNCKSLGVPCSIITLGSEQLVGFRKSDEYLIQHVFKMMRDEIVTELENENVKEANYNDIIENSKINVKDALNSEYTEKPTYIYDTKNPNNYVIVTTTQEIYEVTGQAYTKTNFEVYNNGELQKCETFSHGEFTRHTDNSISNTSSVGEENWDKLQQEIIDKGGLSDNVLIFNSIEEVEKHKELLKQQEKLDNLEKIITDDNLENKVESNNINADKTEPKEQVKNYNQLSIEKALNNKYNEKPIFICDSKNHNNYMIITATQEIYERTDRPYTKTNFEVYNNGELQKCETFKHGMFTRHTDNAISNTSAVGEENWDKLQQEIIDKGGFSDTIYLFDNENDFNDYREEMQQAVTTEKEKVVNNDISQSYDEENKINQEEVHSYYEDSLDYQDISIEELNQYDIQQEEMMKEHNLLEEEYNDIDYTQYDNTLEQQKDMQNELSSIYEDELRESHDLDYIEEQEYQEQLKEMIQESEAKEQQYQENMKDMQNEYKSIYEEEMMEHHNLSEEDYADIDYEEHDKAYQELLEEEKKLNQEVSEKLEQNVIEKNDVDFDTKEDINYTQNISIDELLDNLDDYDDLENHEYQIEELHKPIEQEDPLDIFDEITKEYEKEKELKSTSIEKEEENNDNKQLETEKVINEEAPKPTEFKEVEEVKIKKQSFLGKLKNMIFKKEVTNKIDKTDVKSNDKNLNDIKKGENKNKNPQGNIRNLVSQAERRLEEEKTPLKEQTKEQSKAKDKKLSLSKER